MTYYKEVKDLLAAIPSTTYKFKDINKYLGSTNTILCLPTKERGSAIKQWYLNHKDLDTEEITKLIDTLIKSSIYEEKVTGSHLLALYKNYRKTIPLEYLSNWLQYLSGWAEVDNFCYGMFKADEIVARLEEWKEFLRKLNNSNNISERRASLVYLCKPTKKIFQSEFKDLAFTNIKNLIHEKDILITKAISWLMRDMIKNYREDIIKFLAENKETLPKIAIREVNNKLTTGKK